MENLKILTAEKFNEVISQNRNPIIVIFCENFNSKCILMEYQLYRIQKINDNIRVYKFIISEDSKHMTDWNLKELPTIALFKHGWIKKMVVGVVSEYELRREIDIFLKYSMINNSIA